MLIVDNNLINKIKDNNELKLLLSTNTEFNKPCLHNGKLCILSHKDKILILRHAYISYNKKIVVDDRNMLNFIVFNINNIIFLTNYELETISSMTTGNTVYKWE